MAPHDEEAYERVNMDEDHTNNNSNPYVDSAGYAHANPYAHDDNDDHDTPAGRYGAVPSQRSDLFNQDTEYTSGGGADLPSSPRRYSGAASRVSYSDEPAKFPPANYDRIGSMK
ncbi:hypothetical protein E4U43_005528 [Claviceps pusilla]|uniref:Uncharacterized protein n=1 Tax=Claviceps pusilla TaxID=123648 RepID=A0A9P7N2H3_9HYPO|nr:hypothetical protein E4U43_005528 [Claviceps pusilla]